MSDHCDQCQSFIPGEEHRENRCAEDEIVNPYAGGVCFFKPSRFKPKGVDLSHVITSAEPVEVSFNYDNAPGTVKLEGTIESISFGDGSEAAPGKGRYFPGGAYRDGTDGKPEYAGFLSPIVIQAFGAYMDKHRRQSDGVLRDSDNWKQGMPKRVYLESLFRHFHDVWMELEGYESRDGLDEALGGLLFNVQGLWHEILKERMEEQSCAS